MIIDTQLLDSLTSQAQASPRLRINLDLRTSAEDGSQRMLNAIETGSMVPVHRHQKSSETVVVLRGRAVEEYYDDAGNVTKSVLMTPVGDYLVADVPCNDLNVACALNIPAGQWHTIKALDSGTVILEMKDGAYEPIREEDILR